MEAKELMIGDWVIFKAETPKMCKVVSITTDYGNFIRSSLTDTYYTEDCFEPIPLTAEILEKNGLEKEEYEQSFIGAYFPEDEEFYLEITQERDGRIFWTINGDEYHIMPLKYVHELQQALRLLGIDKEINL